MDIETIKVILQAATLSAVVIGLWLTIRQLRLTTDQLGLLRKNNSDLHDWNRRKAAQDAIDDMVPRIAADIPLLNKKFHLLTNRGETIPIETIEKACRRDEAVRIAIHRRLNYFESLAAGVQQGVFDEEVIKNTYQHLIGTTLIQFREYVERHRKDQGSKQIWNDLEDMHERWAELDRVKQARDKTDHDLTQIRPPASESEGG